MSVRVRFWRWKMTLKIRAWGVVARRLGVEQCEGCALPVTGQPHLDADGGYFCTLCAEWSADPHALERWVQG